MFEQLLEQSIANTLAGNLVLGVLIAIAFAMLIQGADYLVESAVEIARDLGIPKIIIGATIVSLGTTAPEACVSVMAAMRGEPGLAIGNGVGSLICDLALILGGTMMFARLPINRFILNRQAWVVLGSAVLFAIFAYGAPDRTIGRTMGLILLTGLAGYMALSYRWAKLTHDRTATAQVPAHPVRPLWLSLIWMAFGLGLLVVGSDLLIPAVTIAAERMHIPSAVIAATIVAMGTSLPELMTAITSIRKGHPEITLGNVIGADVLNILFVIGASATATPLKVEPVFYWIQAPFMLGLLVLFRIYIWTTHGHFRRWQGALFVMLYVLFVAVQYIFTP